MLGRGRRGPPIADDGGGGGGCDEVDVEIWEVQNKNKNTKIALRCLSESSSFPLPGSA